MVNSKIHGRVVLISANICPLSQSGYYDVISGTHSVHAIFSSHLKQKEQDSEFVNPLEMNYCLSIGSSLGLKKA